MPEQGNALSRNPNICASCSSLADGMEDLTAREMASPSFNQELTSTSNEGLTKDRREHVGTQPVARHVPMSL